MEAQRESFAVQNATGFTIVWVCFEARPPPVGIDRRNLMSRDEARRIAINIAKLPELLKAR